MKAELISVGTEILLGNIVNTNAAYLSKQCAILGINVYDQSVVGDNDKRLGTLFKDAMSRSDVVILTGGLGPTEDDLTKETVCECMDVPLVRDVKAEENMVNILKGLSYTPSHNNYKQALVPKDSIILYNHNGTAPGAIIEKNGFTAILLPGPPIEMPARFEEYVIPYLRSKTNDVLYSYTIKECGIGESLLETMLLDIIDNQTNPTVATYAKTSCSEVRITAKADSFEKAQNLVKPIAEEVIKRLGDNVYSTDEKENIEDALVRLLRKNNLTISVAESCTGGLTCSKIVNVGGASEVFKYGFITYANEAKMKLLGVSKDTLEKYTAVSEKTAREMACGAIKESGADVAVSITGYAGPYDSEDEPKGLVFIGCTNGKDTFCRQFRFNGNRQKIRESASVMALNMARLMIIQYEMEN